MWTAIVIIVGIGVISEMYKHRLDASSLKNQQNDLVERLNARMSSIEERMANLETIVLDKEREKKFDALKDA